MKLSKMKMLILERDHAKFQITVLIRRAHQVESTAISKQYSKKEHRVKTIDQKLNKNSKRMIFN